MSEWITVSAPATVANVGPGFDVMGFAVGEPGDTVEARLVDHSGVHILEITGDNGILPRDPQKNVASIGAALVLSRIQKREGGQKGIELRIHKHIPVSSGLGGSAASGAAGIYAAHLLTNRKLKKHELIEIGLECEKAADGGWHADNIAPALLGGFVLIRSYEPLDFIQIPAPKDLFVVLVCPTNFSLATKKAREVVPLEVSLKSAIAHWANTASLVASLYTNDIPLFGRSLTDVIIEPARAHLIPGFREVQKAAFDAGSFGCTISGAGPTLFAVTNDFSKGKKIAGAMQKAFDGFDIQSISFISQVNNHGAQTKEIRQKG